MKNTVPVVALAVLFAAWSAHRAECAGNGSGAGCVSGGCHRLPGSSLLRVAHPPFAEGRCESCHEPHGDAHPPSRSPREIETLCAGCHTGTGRRIRESPFRHGAIDRDGCLACHEPHGGASPSLLKDVVFLDEWESAPDPPHTDVTELCWMCHDRRLAGERQAGGVTRFRDGDRNLHEAHIAGKKGRTCAACHDTHAAGQPFHLRAAVPFGTGGWTLPVRYTETEDGGTCEVGCHAPRAYRRSLPQAGE